MTIARKPKPKEVEIKNLIEKGGSVPKKQKKTGETVLKNVQLRLTDAVILDIDNTRQLSMVPPSRHTWILTAIKEKLARENK